MPIIKPVSDLRNYPKVLEDVGPGSPVYLTKNGRGVYAIVDLHDYERREAEERLLAELAYGHASAMERTYTLEEVAKELGLEH